MFDEALRMNDEQFEAFFQLCEAIYERMNAEKSFPWGKVSDSQEFPNMIDSDH